MLGTHDSLFDTPFVGDDPRKVEVPSKLGVVVAELFKKNAVTS